MEVCTVEYVRLSALFKGLSDAKIWFLDCDWPDFTWGDTSHAMLPASRLYKACSDKNDADPHEDKKIACQIKTFLSRLKDLGYMMVDLAS